MFVLLMNEWVPTGASVGFRRDPRYGRRVCPATISFFLGGMNFDCAEYVKQLADAGWCGWVLEQSFFFRVSSFFWRSTCVYLSVNSRGELKTPYCSRKHLRKKENNASVEGDSL